jgi:hypothetical protein
MFPHPNSTLNTQNSKLFMHSIFCRDPFSIFETRVTSDEPHLSSSAGDPLTSRSDLSSIAKAKKEAQVTDHDLGSSIVILSEAKNLVSLKS